MRGIWAFCLGLAVSAPVSAEPIRFVAAFHAPGPTITLGQIADLSSAPEDLRALAGRIEVARFGKCQTTMVLSSLRVAERVSALIPALTPWLTAADRTIRLDREAPVLGEGHAQATACLAVEEPIARGDYPLRRQLQPADCPAAAPLAALRYDSQARAARAVRDLQPGEIIPAAPLAVLSDVKPGQKLFLLASVGVVTVERQVEVFQPSAEGRAMFVKAADGSLFSAPAPEVVR